MFVCMHNIKFFEGIMLAKTNPPLVKAGYGPVRHAMTFVVNIQYKLKQ